MNSNSNKRVSPLIQINGSDPKKIRLDDSLTISSQPEQSQESQSVPSASTHGLDYIAPRCSVSETASNRFPESNERNEANDEQFPKARYAMSERGGKLLIDEGYLYRIEKAINNKEHWKCTE